MTAQVARTGPDTPVAEVMKIIDRDGGVIIEDLFSADVINRLDLEVVPQLDAMDYGSRDEKEVLDDFFGARTKRLTNLVASSPTFREHFFKLDGATR